MSATVAVLMFVVMAQAIHSINPMNIQRFQRGPNERAATKSSNTPKEYFYTEQTLDHFNRQEQRSDTSSFSSFYLLIPFQCVESTLLQERVFLGSRAK